MDAAHPTNRSTHYDSCDRLCLERDLLTRGVYPIAGVDEAGRGPLAGPVVAAAVVLPELWIRQGLPAELTGLNDSKQLTARQRDRYFDLLTGTESLLSVVATIDAPEIDQLNILRATHRAMIRAVGGLTPAPHHALVDGLPVPGLPVPHTAVVGADATSSSVAAASVIAKVTRDRFMLDYDRLYPGYGFAQHKGYGTPAHLQALRQLGPCPIHRHSFAPIRVTQLRLFTDEPVSPAEKSPGATAQSGAPRPR